MLLAVVVHPANVQDRDGAEPLLRKARGFADNLGVSFHVGSQCMNPSAYRDAIELASQIIREAGVILDVVDVGGGFPSAYPGMTPPDLELYVKVIKEAFEEMPVAMNAQLWCEPGRALVAESTSILARVELVKDGALHINDGSYGNLFDAAHCKWPFPVKAHRPDGEFEGELVDGLGGHAGLDIGRQQIQRLGGKPSGLAHALEIRRAMELDLAGLAGGGQSCVDEGHLISGMDHGRVSLMCRIKQRS
jgi:hypothetical protein